jgi:hypothetical protein
MRTNVAASVDLPTLRAAELGRAAAYRWLDNQERATCAKYPGLARITTWEVAARHCEQIATILGGAA